MASCNCIYESGFIPTDSVEGEFGYFWIIIPFDEDFMKDVYITEPIDGIRHGRSRLSEEILEMRHAKGLPGNAPEWAHTLESRRIDIDGVHLLGEGIDVIVQGDFKVIKLICARSDGPNGLSRWHEKELFATVDGENDNTKEYRRIRFEREMQLEAEHLEAFGLECREVVRFQEIPKKDWQIGQKDAILRYQNDFRNMTSQNVLDLATAVSATKQNHILEKAVLIDTLSLMSCPQVQQLAQKALYVFFGKNICDFVQKAEKPKDDVVTPTQEQGTDTVTGGDSNEVEKNDVALSRFVHTEPRKVQFAVRAPKCLKVLPEGKPVEKTNPGSKVKANASLLGGGGRGKEPVLLRHLIV